MSQPNFMDDFHTWLEANGVSLGDWNETTQSFNASINLNKLKSGIMREARSQLAQVVKAN